MVSILARNLLIFFAVLVAVTGISLGLYFGIKNDDTSCGILICQNGGKCFDGACDCPDWYFGLECEKKAEECGSGTCEHGKCLNDSSCKCDIGWAGAKCDTCALGFGPPGVCKSVNCGDGRCYRGTCVDNVCICDPGVTGRECDQVISCEECSTENTQSCDKQQDGTIECVCKPGFEGLKCEKKAVPGKTFYNTFIDVTAPDCYTSGPKRQQACQAIFASERVPDEPRNCTNGCNLASRPKCRIENWYADDSFDLSKWDGPCNEGKLPPGFEVADKNGQRLKWHRTPIMIATKKCGVVGDTNRNKQCLEEYKIPYSKDGPNCTTNCSGSTSNKSSCVANYWYAYANFDPATWNTCAQLNDFLVPPGFIPTDEFARPL